MSSVTATRATRTITVSDCVITAGQIGRNLSKEPLEVCAFEWKPGEGLWQEDVEKIGALSTEQMFLNVALPPEAFALLWAMEKGSARTIHIKVKINPSHSVLSVTEVTLVEHLP